jgi:hypothetical protein
MPRSMLRLPTEEGLGDSGEDLAEYALLVALIALREPARLRSNRVSCV